MARHQIRHLCVRLSLPLVAVAAAISAGLVGCASRPDGSPAILPITRGLQAETEGFKQRVKNDPFPTAKAAGGGA